MQSAAIHYAQPVTFYSFLYVATFHLFSNISKNSFWAYSYIFVENFKRYLLIKKDVLVKRRIEEKFQKYWERNFLRPTRYLTKCVGDALEHRRPIY